MIDFEASNGAQVVLTNAGATGYILVERDSDTTTSISTAYLGFEEMVAWREFEQQRRDAALGRWRWPEDPDYVVYPVQGTENATVLRESTPETRNYSRTSVSGLESGWAKAAAAYFEAHPERKLPTEPGTVLQGTGPNRSILHRSYAVNGHAAERPWAALGGATYDDEGAWTYFHGGQFVVLIRPEDAS